MIVVMLAWPAMVMAQPVKINCCKCSAERILEAFRIQTGINYACRQDILDNAPQICFDNFKGDVDAFIEKLLNAIPDIEARLKNNHLSIAKKSAGTGLPMICRKN